MPEGNRPLVDLTSEKCGYMAAAVVASAPNIIIGDWTSQDVAAFLASHVMTAFVTIQRLGRIIPVSRARPSWRTLGHSEQRRAAGLHHPQGGMAFRR